MKTYGRTTIYANYSEDEILNSFSIDKSGNYDLKNLDKIIIDILQNSASIHEKNKTESIYLINYLHGDQDIKNKVKQTREEINNKTTENWAWAMVDFKKNNLLGKPIQYVQEDDSSADEISVLNKYVKYEGKKTKDMNIYEDVLTTGRGFRYNNKNLKRNINVDDEAPFEIINCPVEDTEVVYSSKLGNEQLLEYIATGMVYTKTYENDAGEIVSEEIPYSEYTVYLRNLSLVYNNKSGSLKRVEGKEVPLLWNEHLITEYYTNRRRISLIEIGKDLFDDLNYLESLDKDDMEQFVNAIMVFTNCTVSEEDLDDIKALGAVCINSTDQKKASVDLLQGRLSAVDTQTYYTRLLTALHQILGVPLASDSGSVSTGDTGKSHLVGQGFATAGIRSEGEETYFGECDKKSLKVILKICRETKNSGISNLKVSDVDNRFQRDMSENLLVKTQGLLNLYSCDIPRNYANSIVNLFSDPNAVTKAQEELFGEQTSQLNAKSSGSSKDEVNKQNNAIGKTEQLENQGL